MRSISGNTFAFLPHRFLREGFFASLARDQLRLYVLLVLAADRNGLSFYHYDSICSLLEIPLETYIRTRNALIDKDLIAFDGTRFQVLSLPDTPQFDNPAPLTTDDDRDNHDPATIHSIIRQSLRPGPSETDRGAPAHSTWAPGLSIVVSSYTWIVARSPDDPDDLTDKAKGAYLDDLIHLGVTHTSP